jgi:acyl-CoA reductase-like NAD-dependent aldehyde dehydrogenase
MALDSSQVDQIVEAVVRRVKQELGGAENRETRGHDRDSAEGARSPAARTYRVPGSSRGRRGIFDDIDSAVEASRRAFEIVRDLDLAVLDKCIQAMREANGKRIREISEMAVKETGLGRVEDKVAKNETANWKTPGREILRTIAFTGDDGLTLHERGPFGVIASVTPSTNPTETIINNAISAIAAGNAIVFNVHPGAKGVCRHQVEFLNDAIVAAGGPENLITMIAEPTIESAQALMKHAGVRVVVVTGGMAVVKQAMTSGKRAICAGPGNPPVVVDETADLDQAGRDVVRGASMDNNIICIVEKEIFAVQSIADGLKESMLRQGAYEVKGGNLSKLEKLVVTKDGHPCRDWIGKDAAKIAAAAGFSVPEATRLLVAETDAGHPFVQLEMLMPVIPFVRVRDVDEGIAEAVKAEHGFFHTAVMHSKNIDNLHNMARAVNTSLFVKNAPSYAGLGVGGEGYTAWTIAGSSGDGLTTALTYTRERRCTLKDRFRII